MTDVSGDCLVFGCRKAPDVKVDGLRFLIAFVMAPVVVGVLGFWAIVPLYAVPLGAPFWVLFGGPVSWMALRRGMKRSWEFALLGFIVNLATPVVVFVVFAWSGDADAGGLAMFFFGFGAVFAPVWSAMFAFLYRA